MAYGPKGDSIMASKKWFTVTGVGRIDATPIVLAKVQSKGLAHLIAEALASHYGNVTIR